jgi:hypothetical protein
MSAWATAIPFTHNTLSSSRTRTSSVMLKPPISIIRLLGVLEESGEDDYGVKGPSQYAFLTAFKIVFVAIGIAGEDFASSPSVDSEGGIRITWKRGDRTVKLVCPAASEKAPYVYHASPEGSWLRNENVDAAYLAGRLCWLINRES